MYVDCDYESIEPIEALLRGKECCFALEPFSHCDIRIWGDDVKQVITNALMLTIPRHPFIQKIIKNLFSEEKLAYASKYTKFECVLKTTGPGAVIETYGNSTTAEKNSVYLIPAKYVSPFDFGQAHRFRTGEMDEELENCLEEAYAVHYFFSDWRKKR